MDKVKFYRRNAMILTFLILCFGIFMVYDASYVWSEFKYGDSLYYFKRQSIFALIGIVLFFIAKKIPLKFLEKHVGKFLIFSFLSLILVLIPGIGLVRGGSSSWLGFGPISIQPSEIFKIAIILYFAKFLSADYKNTKKARRFIFPLFLCGMGIFLIMLQPDFGTSMVIVANIYVHKLTPFFILLFLFLYYYFLLLF